MEQKLTSRPKKVQLIRPPMDEWYKSEELLELVSVPIGPAILSASIREMEGVKVEIIDGIHSSLDKIKDHVNGDVVGASEVYSQHLNSLEILEYAKKKGATTILGGPNVNYLASRILKNHPFVDYVVVGDGEEALPQLLTNDNLQDISNLVFRGKNEIMYGPPRNASLTTMFDLEDIVNLDFNPKNIFPLFSIRGCIKAEKKGRCSFCSMKHSLVIMEPELVWKQISILNERYDIDYFWETGDSFIVKDFPERLLKYRPENLKHIKLRIFATPDQITKKSLDILSELNTKAVIIGVDAIDDHVLELAGKSYRRANIENAVNLLEDYNIKPHLTLIYGLSGETKESAERIYKFVRDVISRDAKIIVNCSFPIPFPGTRLYANLRNHELVRKEYKGDLDHDDFFDYKSLVKLHLKYFTSTEYDEIQNYIKKTKCLVKERGHASSFGINEYLF